MEEIRRNPLYMPDAQAAQEAAAYLDACMKSQDSSGGVIECVIHGMPAGVGQPVFGKLDALLAQAVLSIGAVKGFEVGDGFAAARAKGSENNDPYRMGPDGAHPVSNHAGGILGGITDGAPVVWRMAIKPTPSIAQPQRSVDLDAGVDADLSVRGRHDPCIVARAVPVAEAACALALMDALVEDEGQRAFGTSAEPHGAL